MITALELKNFAIVDKLRLELGTGFNVLTGETGAGKSILIDALGLLLGSKADTSIIRAGADESLIQAEVNSNIESLSRRIKRGGKGNYRVDGEIVKLAEFADIGNMLIVIHGQHASQGLLNNSEQRKLLDRCLGAKGQKLLEAYKQSYAEYQKVKRELELLYSATRERAQRIDMLSFQIQEIEAAKLEEIDEDALRERTQNLRYAERIMQDSGQALGFLNVADDNVMDLLTQAARHLESASRFSKDLEALSTDLAQTVESVQAVSDELEDFLAQFEVQPGELEELEHRLHNIDNLKLKYGEDIPTILSYLQTVNDELHTLEHADENVERLEKESQDILAKLDKQATELFKERSNTAKKLSKNVTTQVKPLGMANANFLIEVTENDTLKQNGKDDIQFLFSANLGEAPAPLNHVASGGELSRIMLALNVCSGYPDMPTLAFDEVDAGIGGQTARSVGKLLKQLAFDHQVLVVTHLAQVAAFADQHFYVEKIEQEGRTTTNIQQLSDAEREAELARMLSGSDSATAIAHAKELLEESQQQSIDAKHVTKKTTKKKAKQLEGAGHA